MRSSRSRFFTSVVIVASSLVGVVGLLPNGGCVGGFAPPLGITTGGVKDMAYARQVIEDGGIPEPSAITVEGMLSEHSIDLAPPRDAGALYSTATVAWNTDFDELTPLITVQVGFGTNIDPATFKRTPLNLCLVIDRSGSMNEAFDERTRTSKLEAVRIAVDRLLARLKPSDRISVVAFATDPGVLLDPVPGNDIAAVKSALDEIEVQGNTDLARGMLRGYRLVQSNHDASRSDRLMVFTDARITAGVRQSGDLIAVMEDFVAEGIGATIVGVGTDFGQELAADISQVRGGNVVYLSDHDRIVQVFDEEFDFLVSPVAYDVRLAATIPFALDVADAFGFPDAQAGGHTLELLIPSRFYSARQGGAAIFIRLRPGALVDFDETVEVATLTLDYRTSTGDSQSDSMQITLPVGQDPDAAEPYFETEATQRAVLLLNTALALKNASRDAFEGYDRDEATGRTIYQFPELDDVNRALARLTEFLPYFDDLAAGLPDQSAPTSRSLSQERAVVESLLNNIRDQHAFRETR